ncbi:MAG: hypothetical protein NT024_14360, partial [Proteobacteria bacterium]|nr:hypothetical protein [Pseudomonadota bacterium]
DVPEKWRNVHTPFSVLYNMVRKARNDAMHTGAAARHLTTHAVTLALILEDSLMEEKMEDRKVSDYMVSNVVCAELWQPVSLLRERMLTNSFSYLPVRNENGQWCLVSDREVAIYLYGERQKERLAKAISKTDIPLAPATLLHDTESIAEAWKKFDGKPMLVCSANDTERLVGILTAFDLL